LGNDYWNKNSINIAGLPITKAGVVQIQRGIAGGLSPYDSGSATLVTGIDISLSVSASVDGAGVGLSIPLHSTIGDTDTSDKTLTVSISRNDPNALYHDYKWYLEGSGDYGVILHVWEM
jgi:hypothetical protein